MPHDLSHGHQHHHIDPEAGDARVAWAVAVNMALTLAQVVGGILSGSLALIADALHNFSDAVALIIAFLARKIARRPTDADMSFGYGRIEVVAALVNYTTLVVIALYLTYEGIMRFFDPQPIDGWLVVWVAAIALIVDLITAALTYSMSKESMNIRAAFLHNLADALGSVAVIVAGTAVIWKGWTWVDPLVTLMIAGYILWHVKSEIGGVVRVLMLGTPPGVDTVAIVNAVRAADGVADLHHLHLWQMLEHQAAMQAHIVIEKDHWTRSGEVKANLKNMLVEQFNISHATLELECADDTCGETRLIGH